MATVVVFAELSVSPTQTIRTASAGFDIVYNSNTYAADGYIADIGRTKRILAFENVQQELVLNLVNKNGDTTFRDAFISGSYRLRNAKIYKGEVSDSGVLSNVVVIKDGPMNAINDIDDNGTVSLMISSDVSRSQRTPENVAVDVIHQDNIKNGRYGHTTNPPTDTIFKNAQKGFENVVFGDFALVEAVYKRKKILFGLAGSVKVLKTPERPERAGVVPATPGLEFQPAKIYGGRAGLTGGGIVADAAIINAWNPTAAQIESQIGGITGNLKRTQLGTRSKAARWRGVLAPDDLAGIDHSTRFMACQYAVAVGENELITIDFDDLNVADYDNSNKKMAFVRPTNLTPDYTADSYLFGELIKGTASMNAYAIVQWGHPDQTVNTVARDTSSGTITDDSRGIGQTIVTIFYEAGREGFFANSIPSPVFRVQCQRIKDYIGDSNSYSAATESEASLTRYTSLSNLEAASTGYTLEIVRAETAGHIGDYEVIWVSDPQNNSAPWDSFATYIYIKHSPAVASSVKSRLGLPATGEGSVVVTEDSARDFIYLYQDSSNSAYLSLTKVEVPNAAQPNILKYTMYQSRFPEITGSYQANTAITFGLSKRTYNPPTGVSTTPQFVPATSVTFPRVMIDYLTDQIAGPGVPVDNIDFDSFYAAEGARRVYHQCDGQMQGRASYQDYVHDLEDSSGLTIYEEDGKLKCYQTRPYAESDISHEFTDANTVSIKFKGARNDERYNRLILKYTQYIDELEKPPEIETGSTLAANEKYLMEDLLQDNLGEHDAPYLSTFYTEQPDPQPGTHPNVVLPSPERPTNSFPVYSQFLLDKSRYSDQVEIETTYQVAKDIKLGRPFTVNKELYGWTGLNEKVFETIEVVDNHDGTMTIIGVEHSNRLFDLEDDYPNLITEDAQPQLSDYTGTRQVSPPGAPSAPTATANANHSVSLSWTAPTGGSITRYLVEWKLSTEDESAYKTLIETDTLNYTHVLPSDQVVLTYNYRIVARGPGGSTTGPAASVNVSAAVSAASALNLKFRRPVITVDGAGEFVNADAILELFDGESRVTIVDTDQDSGVGNDQYRMLAPVVSQTNSVNDFTAANATIDTVSNSATFALSDYVADGTLTAVARYKTSAGVFVEISAGVDILQSAAIEVVQVRVATNNGTSLRPNIPTTTLKMVVSIDGVDQSESAHMGYDYTWSVGDTPVCVDSSRNVINDGDDPLLATRDSMNNWVCSMGTPADSTAPADMHGSMLREITVGSEDVDQAQQFQFAAGNIT